MQEVQAVGLSGEILDGMERIQNYGFTAVPHSGAEGIVVFAGGDRSHGLVIAVEDKRYRLKSLQNGEVAIYTDEGDNITLKRGKVIEINTDTLVVNASVKCQFNTPLMEVSGEIKAVENITDQYNLGGSSMANMRNIYNSHTHTGDDGGTTSTPHQGV